ncbi:MAG: hypothetical protein ACJAQZ_002042 [Planctomycetota bacterium]|jgi:hypothetical protein
MSLVATCLFVLLAQDPGALASECERFHGGVNTVKMDALNNIAALSERGAPQSVAIAEALAYGLKSGSYQVRELAVQLITTRPNVAVVKRELLLASHEALLVLQEMTDLHWQVENSPPVPRAFDVNKAVWMAAMDASVAKTNALLDYMKSHEDFRAYHNRLMTSLAAFPGEATVSVLAGHLAAMTRSSEHAPITKALAAIGSKSAADALVAHFLSIEQRAVVEEASMQLTLGEAPGNKVPKMYSKANWAAAEKNRIASIQRQARTRVEQWQDRRAEVHSALQQLAEAHGLTKPKPRVASLWRAWVEENRESLAEKV